MNRIRSLRNRIFSVLGLLALWQIAAFLVSSPVILPSPLAVADALVRITVSGDLPRAAAVTLARGLAGASLAFVIGTALGILMGTSRAARDVLTPPVLFVQSTPVISWLLLALIWIDNTWVPLFIIVLSVTPLFILSVSEGIRHSDPKLREMALVFRVGRGRVLRDITIPSILGFLSSSLRIVFGMTYRTAVMAEVLSHPGSGVGEKMSWARINVETAEILAWTVVIVLFAMASDGVVSLLVKKFRGRASSETVGSRP